ncbi:ABC transporter permease [Polynucleobacter sp. JS-JIR-II-c23]|uniref:ABC transporter permease n=1 Tax=Polynucleobacter sp. JS-JIR-II-c23 TaxID=1758393 RepID=UPI002B2297C4|nr:ABC transporter permease [Polynucleobacter sp. JS-JIR-II-c23]MEA9603807.1 ABC transporter permease [Polynucleobacter sp. JS-JIR-II-c23]
MISTSKSSMTPITIQYQVIKALILREIITRWGRNNIGFLWIFCEQLLVMLSFWLLYYVHSFRDLTYVGYGISLTAFVLIGHAPLMLYRNSVNLLSNAIKSNTALLHHRNLRPLDFYVARFILEAVGNTASLVLLMFFCILFGFIPAPRDPITLIFAWALFLWFSFGFGLSIGILVAQYITASIIWRFFSVALIIISGAYFYVIFLPPEYQKYALMLPMVNGSEMMKHGYFGEHIKTFEDPSYFAIWCLVLNFIGLMLAKIYGTKLPQRL